MRGRFHIVSIQTRTDHPTPTEAAAPPVVDPELHPALDQPVTDPSSHRGRLDKVVFGAAAAVAVAFLVWGFVSTESLAEGLQHLARLGDDRPRLALRADVECPRGVRDLARHEPVRHRDPRPRRRGARVPHRLVDCDDVQRRHGDRPDVLRRQSEPITHFATPPPGTGEAGNAEAAQHAMATTLFHWTLHPWAMYAVVGLAIAYGVYRKGRLQLISAAFEPLLGQRAHGPAGKVIDMLAIFATLFGSAASLGLGALQISQRPRDRRRHRPGRQHRADRDHRRAHRGLRALRRLRCRQGHPVAVQHQHGAGGRARGRSSSSSARPSSSSTWCRPRSAATCRTSR